MGTTGTKSFNILVAFMRVLVVLTLVLFSAVAPAYSWGEIDESGSYYCEGGTVSKHETVAFSHVHHFNRLGKDLGVDTPRRCSFLTT